MIVDEVYKIVEKYEALLKESEEIIKHLTEKVENSNANQYDCRFVLDKYAVESNRLAAYKKGLEDMGAIGHNIEMQNNLVKIFLENIDEFLRGKGSEDESKNKG